MVNSWKKANTTTIWQGSSKHNKDDKILQYIKKKGVKAIILTPFSLYFIIDTYRRISILSQTTLFYRRNRDIREIVHQVKNLQGMEILLRLHFDIRLQEFLLG